MSHKKYQSLFPLSSFKIQNSKFHLPSFLFALCLHSKFKIQNSKFLLLSFSFLLPSSSFPQTYLTNFTNYSAKSKVIEIEADSSKVKFIFYAPDIVKVQFLPSPSTIFDSSLVVIQDTSANVSYSIAETDSSLSISTSSIKIVCSKNPLRISYYDSYGKQLLSEPLSGGLAFYNSQRIANFSLNPNDHFYGTGERGTALDKRGLAFDSYNQQIGGYSTPLPVMNINVPFLASSNGYALYFDNTYPGHFDLGYSNPQKFFYSASGGELSYFFIAAPNIPAELEKYTWLTGRQPLPPRWAFGYIQSKYGYHSEFEASSMIQTMRGYKIPCDAIVLDLYWYNNMGDLSWNLSSFPNPVQMMNTFLSEGIKTIAITEPYLVQYSNNFAFADQNGYFAKYQNGSTYYINGWWSCGCTAALLDLTNPVVQNWWWSKYPSFMDSSMAGLWTDLGEPENVNSSMTFYLGSQNKIHNIYDFLWAKTIFNGFNQFRPNQRIFNLTRSGYAGIQRFGAILWSGDVGKSFGGLAVQLPMLLNMGMSGLAYHNSDIGGFTGAPTTPELYSRWMEYGTFCPITRAHGMGSPSTEPWSFDSTTLAIAKKYIRLRYTLLPYIYTMAYENYSSGLPLARPLFFDFPGDPNLISESSSYLWGDDFLVSPVVAAGQTTKSIYLPQGSWIDYWTHTQYTGGQNIIVSAPVDKLPLFVKAGSIIPMQQVMDYSDQFPLDTLTLDVFPDIYGNAASQLYEDDGKTLDYQSGSFAITKFSAKIISLDSKYDLSLFISSSLGNYINKPSKRIYFCKINLINQPPLQVQAADQFMNNSINLPAEQSYIGLKSNDGFYFDSANHILYIRISTSADSSYHIFAYGGLVGVNDAAALPKEFFLSQNYPNPFNPVTNIEYQLPVNGNVKLQIYDILGREVASLIDDEKLAGKYSVQFNASNLSSGIYFYKLSVSYSANGSIRSFTSSKKLILLK